MNKPVIMLLQTQIEEVVDSQQIAWSSKDTGIEREMLQNIPDFENHALIITGIRRCGKSTLLRQLYEKEVKKALYLNFEDIRLAGFEMADFNRLGNILSERGIQSLYFDEIQTIKGWELFIRQKLDEQYNIIITGSNATLLSRELGTKLTGRHISIELFPFSFDEFTQLKNVARSYETCMEYLQTGGFPEFIKRDKSQLLNQLLTDILYRDIAVRYNIRNIFSLRQLAVYLISNIGKPFSGNKLTKSFNLKSTSTTLDYISHLEQAYVIQTVPVFSHSLKAQARNPKKIYAIDLGLFSQNSIVFSDEKGRRLENLVFLTLRRQFNQIYYFKDKGECDFVALDNQNNPKIIQVCWELNDINLKREIEGLQSAMDYFNINNGTIITANQTEILDINKKTIEVVPVDRFLAR